MADLTLETVLTEEQREYLETLKFSADSLLSVINDILDFSKIEAGKVDLEMTDFDLRECIEGTLKTLAVRASERGNEITCDLDASVPQHVCSDSLRVRQVLVNLVGNAVKFTDHGEISVRVSLQSANPETVTLLFVVTDTGAGITPEKLSLIFDPFSQADTSTTRKFGGTGLGLTISSRLVKLLGGEIGVESEVGRGSKFFFSVVCKTCQNPLPAEVPPAPDILCRARVLVVDDNQTNRRILEGMLRNFGFSSHSVGGGEEALQELRSAQTRKTSYSLILTDTQMPKMDGFELVREIRQIPEYSATPVLMLTSSGLNGESALRSQLGIARRLHKPVRQSELREAILRVLCGGTQKSANVPELTRDLATTGSPSKELRILVAEDNTVNQRLITRLLQRRGHNVTLASTGWQALQALESGEFDLVFMDIQMPEMDGMEATQQLRAKERATGKHQPVIALTAHAMKGDEEKCRAAGMDAYLTKPIRIAELDELLRKYQGEAAGQPGELFFHLLEKPVES